MANYEIVDNWKNRSRVKRVQDRVIGGVILLLTKVLSKESRNMLNASVNVGYREMTLIDPIKPNEATMDR